MDNKKFEQLINLIINEDEEKARALFHDIVVEKSREIYEGMMDEEGMDEVGSLQNEISMDEQGMTEEEEDEFADIESDEDGEEIELDAGEFGDEGEGELEDRVVDLEDKLDELMAEFEQIMSGDDSEEDMGGEEEFGGDEDMMESEDDLEESEDENLEEDEESLEESVQLQKVKSVTHGDNGQQTRSTVASKNPIGARPANRLGGQESAKGGTQGGVLNPTPKDIPGNYKNAPGAKFTEKGEAAPKAKAGDNGQNSKSITSESRKTTKRIVK